MLAFHLEENLEMILQVFSNAREFVNYIDTGIPQNPGRPEAR